jgi:hypothetical protein
MAVDLVVETLTRELVNDFSDVQVQLIPLGKTTRSFATISTNSSSWLSRYTFTLSCNVSLAEYVHRYWLFSHLHLHSFHSYGETEAGEERIQIELGEAYLGQQRTSSSERSDFDRLCSILMPYFSVAIVSTDVCSNHESLGPCTGRGGRNWRRTNQERC